MLNFETIVDNQVSKKKTIVNNLINRLIYQM